MIAQDFRHALRGIRTHPGFAATVALTLSLGLGATTAVFSVIDSVLLRDLPFPAASRLVWAGVVMNRTPELIGPSMPEFKVWSQRSRTISGLAVYNVQAEALSDVETPARISIAQVSAAFFPTLGVRTRLGRAFIADDDRLGAAPVVVLGDSLWRDAFHGDPAIIGRTVTLDGSPVTVVGVMPPDFSFPHMRVAAWVPITPALGFLLNEPKMHMWGAVGRLQPGRTTEQAERELYALSRQLPADMQRTPDVEGENSARVMPLRMFAGGDVAHVLLLVLGASALVLFVTCANAANLLLARATTRRRDVAIRRALGASRWSIVRRLLIESGMLAFAGGVLGVALAFATTRLVAVLGARQLPRALEISVHGGALLFTLLLVLVTTLLCGLAPALYAARSDAAESLKATASSMSEGRGSARWRELLAVAELSLALVLLAGAGVLAKSVALTLGRGRGIASEHLLVASLMRPLGVWPGDKGPMREFGQQLVARLEAVPGVRAAAISLQIPGDPQATSLLRSVGAHSAAGDSLEAKAEVVTADYFRTLGIPLLRGRLFDARLDRPDAPPAIVISRSLAQRFFPHGDPVGQDLLGPGDDSRGPAPPAHYRIVGVVEDIRAQGPDPRPVPEVYGFFAHEPVPHMTVIMRTDATPAAMSAALRRVVSSLDPGQPVADLRPLDAVLAQSAARPKFYLMVLGAFALTAVLLAVVGLFSVMLMTVRQRIREIAVRMALGADSVQVTKLVLRRGGLLVMAGVAIGLAGAWAATRLLASLLSGVSPTDPAALGAAAVALGVVALIASWLPARAASRVDPVAVLRME